MDGPERELRWLCAGMLRQAVTDVQGLNYEASRREIARKQAIGWIMAEGQEADDWPLSFMNCCGLLNLNARKVKDKLLAMADDEKERQDDDGEAICPT